MKDRLEKRFARWYTNHVTVVESIDSRKITQKNRYSKPENESSDFSISLFFTSNYLKNRNYKYVP